MSQKSRLFALALIIAVIPIIANLARTPNETAAATQTINIANLKDSDSPLAGDGVVRRENPKNLPDMKETWTKIIQGITVADGVCGYSLEFYQPLDNAPATYSWITAVDPATCKFEFHIGMLVDQTPQVFSNDKLDKEVAQSPSTDDTKIVATATRHHPKQGRDGSLRPQDEVDPEGGKSTRKMTAYASWEDPVNQRVNGVLSAVKANYTGHHVDTAECKYGWTWLGTTGWVNESTGQWGDTHCNNTNHTAKSTSNGRFQNSSFPACLGSKAWVYYDNVWAKVKNAGDPDDGYTSGIAGTWTDGASCRNLLHWADVANYPGEYWTW